MDGRTDDLRYQYRALHYVHRAVKTNYFGKCLKRLKLRVYYPTLLYFQCGRYRALEIPVRVLEQQKLDSHSPILAAAERCATTDVSRPDCYWRYGICGEKSSSVCAFSILYIVTRKLKAATQIN